MLVRVRRREDGSRPAGGGPAPPSYIASFPKVESKELACSFCKRRLQTSRDLKGFNNPLLLPCGHTTCTNCEIANPRRPCLLCPNFYVQDKAREKLPYNVYMIGLVHTTKFQPLLCDDIDITFQVPSVSNSQIIHRGCCAECGMIAYANCEDCNALFCKLHVKQIHRKTLANHRTSVLNKNIPDFFSNNCPNHEDQASEYYCNICDIECCSNCIIQYHDKHRENATTQSDRNTELMPQFDAALQKMRETKWWTHQTLKNLRTKTSCETVKSSECIENQITKHFIHLHGVLQNFEQKLKDDLVRKRNSFQKDIEEYTNQLHHQEELLASLINIFDNIEINYKTVNVKKMIEKMQELADFPCHITETNDYTDKLSLKIDGTIFDNIQQHIELHIPDVPRFNLVKTEDLPEDYELESMPDDITMNTSSKTNSKGCENMSFIQSTRSTSPSLNGSFVAEPASFVKGSSERVKVTHVINPTDFYVQKLSDSQHLKRIEKEIAEFIDTDPPVPDEIYLNRLYVAECIMDNKWYRARVIDEYKHSDFGCTYSIFFIDYGFTDTNVTIDQIRNSQPLFNFNPGMAVHCTLPEIAPVEEEWTEDVIEEFKKMIMNTTLSMQVIKSSDPLIVKLQKFHNENNLSIYNWLIDTRLAKRTTHYKLKRMNPLSTHRFYHEKLDIEKYTYVYISNIESPNCIYVYKKTTEFSESMKNFYKEYNKYVATSSNIVGQPEYGRAVALKVQSEWQRGMIVKIDEKNFKVQVFLVDIGTTITAQYNQIYHLPNQFCQLNAQAIKVSLIDIAPMGNEWSPELCNYLKSHLEGRTVKIFPFSLIDDTYNVCIFINNTNVNANLISMNYAISTGPHSKHANLNKSIRSTKKQRRKIKKSKLNIEIPDKKYISSEKKSDDSDPFKVRVNINKIISPDAIYVSESSTANDYKKMIGRMQKFYQSYVANSWDKILHPNSYYCVYSPKDKQYCRAQFLKFSEKDPSVAVMFLIDLAETEEIPVDKIQPLDRQFLDLGKYIFKVKLAGIKPCGGTDTWQSTSCQKLKDIINDTGDMKFYITMYGSVDEDWTMPVILIIRRNIVTGPIEPNRKETIFVHRRLVDEGLALPIKEFSEKDLKELAIELKKSLQLHSSVLEDDKQSSNVELPSETSPTDGNTDETETEIEKENKIEYVKETSDDLDESFQSTYTKNTIQCKYWKEAEDLKDNEFNAIVTHVDNSCNVYFHPNTDKYNNMLSYIRNTLSASVNNTNSESDDHIWKKGDLCIACYHGDKKWHRGKVRKVLAEKLEILFVDYGNIEECEIGHVKKDILLEHIPIQCIKASIEGIQPIDSWTSLDLDVIHKLVVSTECFIKIIEKPPNPYKVAIWKIENTTRCPLPYYIKNKTQVICDINLHNYWNDPEANQSNISESTEENFSVKDKSLDLRVPDFNQDTNSSDSSDDSNSEFTSVRYSDSDDFDTTQEDCSETLRQNDEYTKEMTIQWNHMNLSSNINNISNLTKKSTNSEQESETSECNGDNSDSRNSSPYDDEKLISGSSFQFIANDEDDAFDEILSVRSEMWQRDENNDVPCSTPLNNSFTSISIKNAANFIDFQKYKVKWFEMGLGQVLVLSDLRMTGYVISTNNPELNKWIKLCHQENESIQYCIDEQPVFKPEPGQFCIAQYNDGLWYRARALKKVCNNVERGILVEFLDYGDRLTLSDENHIREMRPEWMEIPFLSFYFKLFNVKVASNSTKEVYKAIEKVLGQSDRYSCCIKKYDPELELELYIKKGSKRLVYASLIEENVLQIIDPKQK